MKGTLMYLLVLVVLLSIPFTQSVAQEEDLYDDGTVWSLTLVRTGANKTDTYLKGLANTWVASMMEAKKQGLIVSYKMLVGDASNSDDFNILLMIENKAMANFDPNRDVEAKWDAIEKMVKDKMGNDYDKTIENYDEIRQIHGSKLMREVHLK